MFNLTSEPTTISLAPSAERPDPNAAPFRPFTPDEVSALTGVPTNVLEAWLKTSLPLRVGDDKRTRGLDYVQTFAVWCGWRWIEHGAGPDRAARVVRFVSSLDEGAMRREWSRGNTFPQVTDGAPQMLVRAPFGKIGRELNLRRLHQEFRLRLERHFGAAARS